jgi:hypothetical protein
MLLLVSESFLTPTGHVQDGLLLDKAPLLVAAPEHPAYQHSDRPQAPEVVAARGLEALHGFRHLLSFLFPNYLGSFILLFFFPAVFYTLLPYNIIRFLSLFSVVISQVCVDSSPSPSTLYCTDKVQDASLHLDN